MNRSSDRSFRYAWRLAGAAFILAGLSVVSGCGQIAQLRPPAGWEQAERGGQELQMGRPQRAEAEFAAAVKSAGADYRTAVRVVELCAATRQWPLVERYGDTALKQTPKSEKNLRFQLYGILSQAYLEQNQPGKAVEIARAGFAEDPSDPAAMNLLGYVYADAPMVDKLGEALDLTQKAVKTATSEGRSDEDVATFLDSVGWVKYQQGRVDEAVEDLTRAAYALPLQPDVLYHLGKAYMKQGRYADAMVVLERALKIAPNAPEIEQALKEAIDKIPPKSPDSADSTSAAPGGKPPSSAGPAAGTSISPLPSPHP
jgi:tetratricopeptide (TPR) repeat protein